MAYVFELHPESLKRKFAVYVVVAKGPKNTKIYVGKTGDNREGCNPLISRCGNHFSYNDVHSQVRNKLDDHEDRTYTYVFNHFDDYSDEETHRRRCIERINEMERWLNQRIAELIKTRGDQSVSILNPYKGLSHISTSEAKARNEFRAEIESVQIIDGIVDEVAKQLAIPFAVLKTQKY